MDFIVTEEQKALAEAVRGVLARHGKPAAEAGRSAAPAAHDPELWGALVELGLPAMPWSEDDGGVGAEFADLAAAATELGRSRVQVPLAEIVAAGAMVRRCASDELRTQILGGISEGEALVVPALTEPLRAWTQPFPAPVEVRAEQAGDGWTLTGSKAPVRYAPAATHLVATAAVDGTTALFLVESPGVSVEQVDFDSTPATLLATGELAEQAVQEGIALGAVLLCAEAVGAMGEALTMTADYLRTRQQFGVKLETFQALTHRASDMYAALELSRSATLFAAMVADVQPLDIATVLRARVVVDKAAKLIGRDAIQMHGGIGVTAEFPVGHFTARLRAITHTWGDSRAHLAQLGSRVGDYRTVEVLA
ncbi:MAG: acyl-CoA dehydrogenase family protein [Dermatophilus congolensis]|nr:acyl-CoA dehydrogenase family protein [Dermatophilus congolensis]